MGIKKNLWKLVKFLIAFFAVFFILCVIAALYMPSIPTPESAPAPAPVTVTTGKVTDHNLKTSVKITLEEKKDFYNLSLTGPEGTEVSSAFITKTQMADGKQSVWVPLVGDLESEVAAKPGTYSLSVTNSSKDKVYEETFGPYSGSDLSVIDTDVSNDYKIYSGRFAIIKDVTLTVKNDGDLPAYVSRVDSEMHLGFNSAKGSTNISREREVILPGKTTSLLIPKITILPGPYYSSDYPITFKFKEGSTGKGKTVAVYSARI